MDYNSSTPSFNSSTPSFNSSTPSFNSSTPSFNSSTPSFNSSTPSFNSSTPSFNTSTRDYLSLVDVLAAQCDDSFSIIDLLMGYVKSIYRSELQDSYSKPMVWIGMYIALASLLCIIAMVADLLHGLKNRKLWFPCKYVSINATSLLVISIAMKLPVDLSGVMPGEVDRAAKLGSMAFMCTIMANLLPSLAAMNSNELLTNITALGVLVITLVVNVCIQIYTGVVSYSYKMKNENLNSRLVIMYGYLSRSLHNRHFHNKIATFYVTILLMLLIIHICSSLAILKSKKIIESKYQLRHEKASKAGELLTVDKIQQHVSKYWVMAGSGCPQFIVACSATTTASGVICSVTTILQTFTMSWTIESMSNKDYDSDYKWSMLVILIVQFIGVIVGTIAPFSRCFAKLSFKVSIKSILNNIKVYKVESYWTGKLSEWKQDGIPFSFRSHKLKVIIPYLRNLFLNICTTFQMGVVIVCKMIALIPFVFMICVFYCFHGFKLLLKTKFFSWVVVLGENREKLVRNKDLPHYVLQLGDEEELAERTLEGLSKSLNHFIRKGGKEQPKYLMKRIEESTRDFRWVEKFDDIDHVQSLYSNEYQDCWSLPVVTLTTIATSLPSIEKRQVDILWRSVREGLEYVTLVEESLNDSKGYVNVQKAAKTLWLEVDVYKKWLGNKLLEPASHADTTGQIVEWFQNKSENMVIAGGGRMHIGGPDENLIHNSICANSMYRITKTIMLSYHANTSDKVSQEQLFHDLSSMIADIMAACLTNLPQVIAMKCHTSVIEKREASVQVAAQLLGQTKHIINTIQEKQPQSMKPDDLPFISKWRSYLANLKYPNRFPKDHFSSSNNDLY